jgi:catalase
MVSHLLNIHADLAKQVAEGLGLKEMPKPADAARPTRQDLKKSPALSIILNGPGSFKGRKVGALVTDGVDSAILKALKSALKKEGAMLEIVAPRIGGVQASDGTWIEADQKIDGGPSVLYDAVALLPSSSGASALANSPAARDFVADAFAHLKFIGYVEAAAPLFGKAGVPANGDDGFIPLKKTGDSSAFIDACRRLRCWAREAAVKRA